MKKYVTYSLILTSFLLINAHAQNFYSDHSLEEESFEEELSAEIIRREAEEEKWLKEEISQFENENPFLEKVSETSAVSEQVDSQEMPVITDVGESTQDINSLNTPEFQDFDDSASSINSENISDDQSYQGRQEEEHKLVEKNSEIKTVKSEMKEVSDSYKEEMHDMAVSLAFAIDDRDHKMLKHLINWGVDVNFEFGKTKSKTVKKGNNFLIDAIRKSRRNSLRSVKALISAGAYVNATDFETGETPLHVAAKNGQEEVIILLLHKGANPVVEDKLGRSPMKIARLEWNLNSHKILEIYTRLMKPGESFLVKQTKDLSERYPSSQKID